MIPSIWTIENFFPTSPRLVELLLMYVHPEPGDVLWEPSAGKGNIANGLRARFPDHRIEVIEREPTLCALLRDQGYTPHCADFLQLHLVMDVVVGNPPFSNHFQDIDHFVHAWQCLRPGGQIAMILHEFSGFPRLQTGKPWEFVRFLHRVGGQRRLLPAHSFAQAERSTLTGTCMVWATKPDSSGKTASTHALPR